MSGGYFNYDQYKISQIADDVKHIIQSEDAETLFTHETIAKLKAAYYTLLQAKEMTQRIDWLMSGDDSEESFHSRWDTEIKQLIEGDL